MIAPIAEGLFAKVGEQLVLLGGRRIRDGKIAFPLPANTDEYEPCHLPTQGTVWSWTIQRVKPNSPPYALIDGEAFAAFAMGYVDLGEVAVETRFAIDDLDAMKIGQRAILEICPMHFAGLGERLSYQFRVEAV